MTGGETFTPADRERLRRLLSGMAVVRSRIEVPLVGRGGEPALWMFDSWQISLTAGGLRLAAGGLCAELDSLGTSQIAGFGHTAAPLMAGCVLLGAGRYTGLTVRDRPKGYGRRGRVEGPGDRTRPVVVVDDSLSTGRSFFAACRVLESDGYQVVGLVALVDFPTRGGRERIEARGYRVATLFDVFADLQAPMPAYVPGHLRFAPDTWSSHRVPAGLHPAHAARHVAEHLLDTGSVPLPPVHFDREVDGVGGAYVSFRRADELRLGRGGFWHFDPADADPCRDLVLATVATIRAMPTALDRAELDRAKIAASFLGRLEEVPATALDFGRYGVAVRSTRWPYRAGGALPNTQLFTSTQEQYHHARAFNARITDFEPHQVFRHDVVKYVEPGCGWPAYGEDESRDESWIAEPKLGERLLRRAREVLAGGGAAGERLPDDLVPASVRKVAVAVYAGGSGGHGLSGAAPLDTALVKASTAAAADLGRPVADATVVVSLLYDRERLGPVGIAGLRLKLRRGRDAVEVRDGSRGGLFAESVPSHQHWTAERTGSELARRTGVGDGAVWSTYKSAGWCGRIGDSPDDGVARLAFGYVDRRPAGRVGSADVELLVGHLLAGLGPDGWPAHRVWPAPGTVEAAGPAERGLHGLGALLRAARASGRTAWGEAAVAGIRTALKHLDPDRFPAVALPDRPGSALADARLLDAVAARPTLRTGRTDALADAVARWVRPDGCIRPPQVPPVRSDQDVLPGVVLLALARYRAATGHDVPLNLPALLGWYRRRFELVHPWGLAIWQAKAWAELPADGAEFVFELADWMCGRQLRVDGSFLIDTDPIAPTFANALVADAIGTAARLASGRGDDRRTERYTASWRAAMGFLDRLLVRAEDTFWMPDPRRAVGGVRTALAAGELRVDYTSYTVDAVLAAP